MRKTIFVFFCAIGIWTQGVAAKGSVPEVSLQVAGTELQETRGFHSAIGLGASLTERMSTQSYLTREKAPELAAYGYFPLLSNFWLRSALRLGYNWTQPEMSDSLRYLEKTFRSSLELGLVYSWVLIPSISVGGGGWVRTTQLETSQPIVASKMDGGRTEVLPFLQVQAGVGIPMNGGMFVLEPYARSLWVFGDKRYQWAYGFDFSVEIF